MKILYHATPFENLLGIVEEGLKPLNIEKMIYLAETAEDALKFMAIRGYTEILVCKVKVLNTNKLTETFDHNYNVFKCRAFGYNGEIPCKQIVSYTKYKL